MTATKIVTCNYCGTRAALRVSEGQRHELVCSNCGAPLTAMKAMPSDDGARTGGHPAGHHYAQRPAPRKAGKQGKPGRDGWPPRKQKSRKRKSAKRRLFEELMDIAEDIFD